MSEPSEALVEEIARVLMTACYGAGYWEGQHETQREAFRGQARAVLASPPVRKLVKATSALLSEAENEFEWDGDERVHSDPECELVRAALAPFLAGKETVDV